MTAVVLLFMDHTVTLTRREVTIHAALLLTELRLLGRRQIRPARFHLGRLPVKQTMTVYTIVALWNRSNTRN